MVETNKEGMYPRDKNKDGNNGKDEIETQKHKNTLKKKYLTCPNTRCVLIHWEFH